MNIEIRKENPFDIPAIYEVNRRAFGQPSEAELVNSLRNANALTLSLVAFLDNQIVGHIAFSPVTIENSQLKFQAIGLAPMAVLPEHQKWGIGTKLVQEGLKQLSEAGHKIVVVVGHPEYYPRFGFVKASDFGIKWEHECYDEAFMVKGLLSGILDKVSGTVRFRPEFERF